MWRDSPTSNLALNVYHRNHEPGRVYNLSLQFYSTVVQQTPLNATCPSRLSLWTESSLSFTQQPLIHLAVSSSCIRSPPASAPSPPHPPPPTWLVPQLKDHRGSGLWPEDIFISVKTTWKVPRDAPCSADLPFKWMDSTNGTASLFLPVVHIKL